jgi:hypothetical protein
MPSMATSTTSTGWHSNWCGPTHCTIVSGEALGWGLHEARGLGAARGTWAGGCTRHVRGIVVCRHLACLGSLPLHR